MRVKKLSPVLLHNSNVCVFCATRLQTGIPEGPVAISQRFVQPSTNRGYSTSVQIRKSAESKGWGADQEDQHEKPTASKGWGDTPAFHSEGQLRIRGMTLLKSKVSYKPQAAPVRDGEYKPRAKYESRAAPTRDGEHKFKRKRAPPASPKDRSAVPSGPVNTRRDPARSMWRSLTLGNREADPPESAILPFIKKHDVDAAHGKDPALVRVRDNFISKKEFTKWKHVRVQNKVEQIGTPSEPLSEFEEAQQSRFEQASDGRAVSLSDEKGSAWRSDNHLKRSEDGSDSVVMSARRLAKFGIAGSDSEQSQEQANGKDKDRMRRKQSAKLNSDEDLDDATIERMERRAKRKAERLAQRSEAPPTPIVLPDFISVSNLASALRVRIETFTEKLKELGFEDFSNDHVLSAEDAGLIAQEFNFEPTVAPQSEAVEDIVAMPEPTAEDKELMLARPPVITIMGHVDHGKTTLLDFIRKSSVAAGEHGGITQHIGAFTVNMPSGRTITFLDTPGHAAFLDMRARGANVTDIVILVVAADDSVKPQTLEAIKHAKAAGVPIVVAITKVDKEAADVDRVKRDLAKEGVEVEDFGGDVQAIPVSGKTGAGVEDLEDAAIALADILDVRADTAGQVEGWVLESSMKQSGKVATVLVRRGTMKVGDIVVAGNTWAKIRTLRNEVGEIVREATPGQPVEVDGWDESPDAGAQVLEAPSVQRARQVAEMRQERAEAEKLITDVAALNEQRHEQRQQRALEKRQEELEELQESDPAQAAALQQALEVAAANRNSKFTQVPLVLRADVSGSVEALSAAILAIGNSEIRSILLRADVGQVTESDVELAATARGAIVNFGAPIDKAMRRAAELDGVDVIDGNVIYRVTDDVKALLEAKLPKLYTHKVIGEADVAQVFVYTVKGKGKTNVAGCRVRNGVVEKAKHFKVLRGGQTLHEGSLSALKSHKKEVTEIRKGNECGISFEGFGEFQEGDVIQCIDVVEEKRTL